jgi:hypothetical protein
MTVDEAVERANRYMGDGVSAEDVAGAPVLGGERAAVVVHDSWGVMQRSSSWRHCKS